jgi:hypothetical protein
LETENKEEKECVPGQANWPGVRRVLSWIHIDTKEWNMGFSTL